MLVETFWGENFRRCASELSLPLAQSSPSEKCDLSDGRGCKESAECA